MNKIKVGVVEDELVVAYDICALLSDIGYMALPPCAGYEEAIAMLSRSQPDIVLLDIMLGGGRDGIDVARHIRAGADNIPLLFLTANSDAATVARAQETLPDAYLIKPFHKAQLFSAVEVAIYAHQKKRAQKSLPDMTRRPATNALFIKDGEFFQKVPYDDILFVSSAQNYVTVHTRHKRFMVRATMQDYIQQLDSSCMMRVHRGFTVNVHKIEKVGIDSVVAGGHDIPVSKSYVQQLYDLLRIE